MKTVLKSRIAVWAAIVSLLALLGVLGYIFLPGRDNLLSLPEPDYWPTGGWLTTPPEQQGIDSAQLAAGVRSIQEKHIAIDSLMIVRNGYVVLDAYYSPYDGSFPHDIASVTKSVMTSLIGIAVDQGKIQLDQKVISFFPNRPIANLDERKKSITVRDLVSMRNGMESGCFNGDGPTLDAMRSSPDWVQYALDRRMVHQPDTHFCYDSPGMHLLSAILQTTTGMTALDFARQNLFAPLGISDVIWEYDPQGYTHGWGDLHLKPMDAAKLGYLWLHGGRWDGKQIVSTTWVSESVQAQSRLVGNEYGYGYGWWVTPVDFYALGRGGQYIHVIPSMNTVLVITAGGSEINQIMPFLIKVVLSSRKELPTNPIGQAELAAAISAVSQGSEVNSSGPLPGIARSISGQTYICDTNPAGVSSLRLDFPGPGDAGLFLQMNGQDVFWPVGLDGKYEQAADGQESSGYWVDESTFVLNIFDVGQLTRSFHFAGENLEIIIPESGLTLSCLAQ
jgi:CubicO group peptidase (beta-lactamase class C family)